MNENSKRKPKPRLAVDPGLGPDLVDFIKRMPVADLYRSDRPLPARIPHAGTSGSASARSLLYPVVMGGIVWVIAWALTGTIGEPDANGKVLVAKGTADHMHLAVILVGLLAVAATGVGAFITWRVERKRRRMLREAHGRYVLPDELTEQAQAMLSRAQKAAQSVLWAEVHRADLIDKQRNVVSLPVQVWEIARGLAKYSRLVEKTPKAKGERVVQVLDTRAAALETSRLNIERRVEALEAYAGEVQAADELYAEWRQLQVIDSGSAEVLELLAETAGDELAVAELEGMTGEAAVVSAAFRAAIEAAKAAGMEALPALGEVA